MPTSPASSRGSQYRSKQSLLAPPQNELERLLLRRGGRTSSRGGRYARRRSWPPSLAPGGPPARPSRSCAQVFQLLRVDVLPVDLGLAREELQLGRVHLGVARYEAGGWPMRQSALLFGSLSWSPWYEGCPVHWLASTTSLHMRRRVADAFQPRSDHVRCHWTRIDRRERVVLRAQEPLPAGGDRSVAGRVRRVSSRQSMRRA